MIGTYDTNPGLKLVLVLSQPDLDPLPLFANSQKFPYHTYLCIMHDISVPLNLTDGTMGTLVFNLGIKRPPGNLAHPNPCIA